jgi:hypothetical protein
MVAQAFLPVLVSGTTSIHRPYGHTVCCSGKSVKLSGSLPRTRASSRIVGIGIGFAASLGVKRILVVGLIGLGTPNMATLVIVPLALILVTMAACYLPARRASQVDPIRALRYE